MKDSEALTAGVNTETELPGLLWEELSGSGRCEGTSGQAGGVGGVPQRPVCHGPCSDTSQSDSTAHRASSRAGERPLGLGPGVASQGSMRRGSHTPHP